MKTPKGVLFLFVACFFACSLTARAEVGFSFLLKTQTSAYSLFDEPKRGISVFGSQAMISTTTGARTERVEFDSLFTSARLSLTVGQTDIVTPLLLNYDAYKNYRLSFETRKAFKDATVAGFKSAAQERSGEGIAIDVPFKIKSKTFRRIFGGDNIGLRVQGTITIDGKFRQQKFDEIQAANQRDKNNDFNIDMTQRFTIAGKIGEKVQVDVNQDSERLFDFENSLKLTYTGDKDEIIQKVEAGNVSLSLGTNLATFSGQNKGLFGLKTEAKVGALKLTGIASLERGQKNKQRPNESARRATWTENDFLQNTYFWVTNTTMDTVINGDTLRCSNYRDNYRYYLNRQHVNAQISLREIEVWIQDDGGVQGTQTTRGFAVALQNISRLYLPEDSIDSGLNEQVGSWRRLVPGNDYYFEPSLGYIRLRTPVQPTKALACAFVTAQGHEFGQMTPGPEGVRLILLKPGDFVDPSSLTWDLMFRHVYSVQTTELDRENFKLKIIRDAAGTGQQEEGPPGGTESYLTFFDFDDTGPNGAGAPDGLVDDIPAILNSQYGELHFLDLTPFDPSGYFDVASGSMIVNGLPELQANNPGSPFVDTTLYSRIYSQVQSGDRIWKFETEFKGSTANYDLGPLVLEGSEEVTLNGNRLVRGSDYTIDYLSGQLKILNEAAKAPGADLEITFESGQVFQLDKKTLLGARAEYELWQDSYVGGMVLHLNEKSLDKRVRIGNEPIRNTLYDMDTQLKFRPNFLTAIADRLPLVRTNAGSEFIIDGEVAKVYPNPNSLTNAATGDNNGVAFIDDFEASRRSVPLGMLRKNWTISSIPVDPDIDSLRGRFRWWNPRPEEQVRVQDVFPEREINSQVADRLQSLVLEYVPVGETDQEKLTSWGGAMRYLGAGYEDQSRAQFLEFWIQLPPEARAQGRLVVDLGSISEDALPNDSMNTEDKPEPGQIVTSPRSEYGNGVLSQDEDTGIDGIRASDPADSAYWNGPTRPPVPSWDDWNYAIGSNDYNFINGDENSLRGDESSNIPNSEDLNNNQSLDQANEYFSFNIELNYNNPYIVGGQTNTNRWRLFRIPIDSDDPHVRRTVGNPTLTNVRFARMYLTGMEDSTRIQIVQNDIVTNEWLPEYVNADSIEYISVAVINNHETPGYNSPPGVQGEIDPITNLRQREQSLVLKIEELLGPIDTLNNPDPAVPSEFFVAKNLYQYINMIEYKRIKMFIHGGGVDEALFEDGRYQLVLRLGASYANTDANYYDIIKTVYKGWDSRNHIDVALNDLSILRAWREDPERPGYDSLLAARSGRFAVPLDTIRFPQDSLVINGLPSLQNVGFIALGVRALKPYANATNDEIWVDELRVSDIYKDPGSAGELSSTLRIADLITATGSFTYRDADFHNINTRTGDQNTTETVRGSLSFNLQKFGLEGSGFNLPVSINHSSSEAIPKYVPRTDARVNQDNPDPDVIANQKSTTITASYSKSGNSRNPLVRWTAERLTASWDYSDTRNSDYQTKSQTSKTTNARAGYAFPTARGRGIAPLWFLAGVPLLSELGNPHIYYKPKQLTGAFGAGRTQASRETRAGQKTTSPDFRATASGNLGWDITETMQTSLTQNFGWTQIENVYFNTDADTAYDSSAARARPWKDILNLHRKDLNSESWNWSNSYSPQLSNWLSPTVTYGSTYSWQRNNRGGSQQFNPNLIDQQQLSNSNNIGTDLTLDLRSIIGGGGGGRDGRQRGTGNIRTPATRPRNPVTPDSTQADTLAQEIERGPGFSPLKLLAKSLYPVKKALLVLDPVQLSYDQGRSSSHPVVYGQGDLSYRLGFTTEPGRRALQSPADSSGFTLTGQTTKTETNDYSARSGIRFSRDIRSTFVWSYRETATEGATSRGDYDQTFFWMADDNGLTTDLPFADVTVDWSGLERFPFISRAARTMSVTSGMSSRFKETWNNNRSNIAQRDYTRQFSPLIGVNISWLNAIDSQIRINSGSTYSEAVATNNKSRTSTRDANATLSYTMRTGFRLPILWFGAMRLENSTTFGVTVAYSTSKREETQTGLNSWSQRADEISWSVEPNMNYNFSSTVNGGARIKYSQAKNKMTDKGSRLFEFGINVQIAIRG